MKIWVLAAIGALLIGGLPTAAILLASDDTSASTVHGNHAAHGPAWKDGHGRGHAFGHQRMKPGSPWNQGTPGQRRQQLRQWQQQWQGLTPQQRAKRMSALARQHAAALDKWATCLQQKHDPRSCPRPVPPGLAKKLSPPRQQG